MFKEDEKTGLPKKVTQKERMLTQGKSNSPVKRKKKDSPPDKQADNNPSLNSLIQEMGFTEKKSSIERMHQTH